MQLVEVWIENHINVMAFLNISFIILFAKGLNGYKVIVLKVMYAKMRLDFNWTVFINELRKQEGKNQVVNVSDWLYVFIITMLTTVTLET